MSTERHHTAEESRYAEEDLPVIPHITPYQDDTSRVIHSNFFRRLQGKSQLFPAGESDFFRNRLTHSLEVASVAKSIASKLNHEQGLKISLEVIEVAGLCHDIGHPPFGHQGERVLFDLMKDSGGFEGNAQTIHLVSRVEKLVNTSSAHNGIGKSTGDKRYGLNLTARSLASLLKYNVQIPLKIPKEERFPIKGYYSCDEGVVDWLKFKITGVKNFNEAFKTIECCIMDVADDIAYSTFDLVDALHAGFIRMSDLICGGATLSTMQIVASKVTQTLREKGQISKHEEIDSEKVLESITKLLLAPLEQYKVKTEFNVNLSVPSEYASLRNFLRKLERFATNGYQRSYLARHLMERFIKGIEFSKNEKYPALSSVFLNNETALEVECLKKFVHVTTTSKSRVQVAEYRAKYVIETIFDALTNSKNIEGLLPNDYADLFTKLTDSKADQRRVICDFIAGMTDRYALEFFGRLRSQDPESIFKPI